MENLYKIKTKKSLIDKYRGCLIGGAAGDALGYSVEFLDEGLIKERYGESGITEYDLVNGVAQISDDTQMTLFTANGLLLATTCAMTENTKADCSDYIALCYEDWLRTQAEEYPLDEKNYASWLLNVPELFSSREPGRTCLFALLSRSKGVKGSIENPINTSKGCGGVMRVAPIGIYFAEKSVKEVDMIAAEAAAITHGHELGYIPAAAVVHIIHMISHCENISLIDAVNDMLSTMPVLFPNSSHMDEFIDLIKRAIELSDGGISDKDAIHILGEGWVAEETLAIAIYCALKYSDDFEKALIASVNHNGDSDSTGAVTGNILGAYLGISAIPQKYIDDLELKNVILELADDLSIDDNISGCASCQDETWKQKYVYKTYAPDKRQV